MIARKITAPPIPFLTPPKQQSNVSRPFHTFCPGRNDGTSHTYETVSKYGFTLIEMTMAIVIMGVCGLGLFSVFSTILAPKGGAVQPYEMIAGVELVQEGLERVVGDRRNPDRGFDWITTAHYPVENLPGGYTRTTTIEAWGDDIDNFRQVTVTVTKGGRTVGRATYLVVKY